MIFALDNADSAFEVGACDKYVNSHADYRCHGPSSILLCRYFAMMHVWYRFNVATCMHCLIIRGPLIMPAAVLSIVIVL